LARTLSHEWEAQTARDYRRWRETEHERFLERLKVHEDRINSLVRESHEEMLKRDAYLPAKRKKRRAPT
jgi:hypothetical protein